MRLEVKPPLVHAFDLAANPGWTRGSASGTEPGSWNTAPWLNLFFGGTAIGNDDLLQPVITGADQVVNLAAGMMLDGSRRYPAGESGSSTHVGTGADLFALDAEGLLGCKFQLVTGDPFKYGWVRLVVDTLGAGAIRDWAYDHTDGVGIPAGFTGVVFVPESGRAMLLLGGIALALSRRRRVARWWLGAGRLPISSRCCQSRASTSP